MISASFISLQPSICSLVIHNEEFRLDVKFYAENIWYSIYCNLPLCQIFVADLRMNNGLIVLIRSFMRNVLLKIARDLSRTMQIKGSNFQDECSLWWMASLLFVLTHWGKGLGGNRSTLILIKREELLTAFLRKKWRLHF